MQTEVLTFFPFLPHLLLTPYLSSLFFSLTDYSLTSESREPSDPRFSNLYLKSTLGASSSLLS